LTGIAPTARKPYLQALCQAASHTCHGLQSGGQGAARADHNSPPNAPASHAFLALVSVICAAGHVVCPLKRHLENGAQHATTPLLAPPSQEENRLQAPVIAVVRTTDHSSTPNKAAKSPPTEAASGLAEVALSAATATKPASSDPLPAREMMGRT